MSQVTLDEVRRVAELASLSLTAEEEPRMARDLSAILEYIAQLSTLDTSSVEPMAQVSDILPSLQTGHVSDHGETLRQDVVAPSIDRRAVLAAAPESDGRFFKVPKVIEH